MKSSTGTTRGKWAKTPVKSAPVKSAESKGEVATVRITEDLAPLRIMERVKSLARTSGLPEGAILRSLIMLGLPLAERDLGALVKAPAMCRIEGAAA